MFTMPAGHGLGSGRGLFQAIAGAASVVRRFALAIAPEYSELLQVRRTSQRQRLQSCFKFVAPANANACIQAGERRLPPRLRSHGEQGLVFRRLQMLIRGGCSRTSLETAKLLLALDPDSDLMGVLQCIDYFALRAREYKFLLELVAAPALPGRSASFVREPPLSRREPPLFLPIALNSSAYALMRVARDGGAAPSTSRCPAPSLEERSSAPPPARWRSVRRERLGAAPGLRGPPPQGPEKKKKKKKKKGWRRVAYPADGQGVLPVGQGVLGHLRA
eukprot:tig00000215_g18629.t1